MSSIELPLTSEAGLALFHGAISIEASSDGVVVWRLPHPEKVLYPPDELLLHARMPAGARLACITDATAVEIAFSAGEDRRPFDVCCDGELVGSMSTDDRTTTAIEELPRGKKLLELWLPHYTDLRLHRVALGGASYAHPYEDLRPRWVTYGSSITQCAQAFSPTRIWPAHVARHLNVNLTCLGYIGQCHLDPLFARVMRDLPADALSLKVGINIHYAASLNQRSLVPAIVGFVKTLREKHERTPLAVISPIWCGFGEEEKNRDGLSLPDLRALVADAVSRLAAAGDEQIFYVDGLTLLGADHAHLVPDKLHPSDAGYQHMGQRFLAHVAPRLFAPL
ncbi:MAG: GDSL family lipase [Deltaproteobacteria bacterium]|nr:GDSL family lipase [Deltaproteobacteria bacterium]